MRHHLWIFTFLICCILQQTIADDNTTNTTQKVKITETDLCKKCECLVDTKFLDCKNKLNGKWLTDKDWSDLQNGDVLFDTISFQQNNFIIVPGFPTYPVKNLYLSFNQITNITLGAFQNLTELNKLDLSHNNLTAKSLEPDVFKGQYSPSDILPLYKLEELDLGYNQVHSLDPDVFEHVSQLKLLILCKNIFQVIDHLTETAISSLRYLKTLDLSYMELEDLPDTFLHGPRDLEVLILTGNLLTELPDNIEFGINLKALILDENPMTEFDGENIFPKFKKLEHLSISYMSDLTKIGKGALGNLQNLTTLNAVGNPKLSYIDANAFAKNTSNTFTYPPLEKLYLNNNNLSVLPYELIVRWDNIKEIDLRFNPWTCTCVNSYLINTLIEKINDTNPIQAKEVECSTPFIYKNRQILDLNENKLVTCKLDNYGSHSLVLVGMLIGILVGIPLTIASIVVYRRGCFGLLNNGGWVRARGDGAIYNRANTFNDDFHI